MIIDRWAEQYGADASRISLEQGDLGDHTLGTTRYLDDGSAEIFIHEKLAIAPLSFVAVEWHEFCHAEYFLRTGTSDHHSAGFYIRMLRRPCLALWDMTMAKLVFRMLR